MKKRTSNFNNYAFGSHVMEYGDTHMKDHKLYLYQGFDPNVLSLNSGIQAPMHHQALNQRDADLLFMWHMVINIDISIS